MKKLAIAFSVLILILTSCSSNNESSTPLPPNPSSVLLKKTIEIDPIDGNITTLFSYSGKKIVGATSDDGSSVVFTYTGDLITKLEFFTDTALEQTDFYTYNSNNKLVTYIRLNYDGPTIGVKETYLHNTDGTISYNHYVGDGLAQTQLTYTGKAFFTNGEISKVEKYYSFGGVTNTTEVSNYTYDDKNNPSMNITGYSSLNFSDSFVDGILHNVLTEVNLSNSDLNLSTTYTYNSSNFPITATETDSFGTTTTQLFYE